LGRFDQSPALHALAIDVRPSHYCPMTELEPDLQRRLAEADRALAGGDPAESRALLEAAALSGPKVPAFWQRLATVQRLTGAPQLALVSIDRGLALNPLDFVGLLMRAGLLDLLGETEAGEAYGRALAQRRPDPFPAALAPAIAKAEAAWAAHQEGLETRLAVAIEASTADLTPAERQRAVRLSTNVSRRTRAYHSEATHFHYPGLRELEFHDPGQFAWLPAFEASTDAIACEMQTAAAATDAQLVPYIQYANNEPLAQWADLNFNRDWTAIHLIDRGQEVAVNAALCPQTMALLCTVPQPWIAGCGANAMFSLLAPRTAIPAHVGVANFRVLCHLPLVVPGQCWFRSGASRREWELGQAFVFDDSIEHEAANESDHLRVVMIFDAWHPDLSPAECTAITAMVGAASLPLGTL
jgi:L-ascorbate metabolism protein UlaG (beta-lactamase superfamily)